MKLYLGLMLAMLTATTAQARPVVVELFTSQSCSSCPPADKFLAHLQASDKDILPLSFNVTYWNNLGWVDPYSLKEATDRQSWYVGLQHGDTVYTPEAVVDGTAQLVGSHQAAMYSAIASAKAAQGPSVPVSVTGGAMITVTLGNGSDANAAKPASIWLFGYDSSHTTQIGGGENNGAAITEVNVVRSVTSLGKWMGVHESYNIPRPAGEHMAVLLQQDDGTISGAASN
jgi:hypothetical protein